MPPAAQALGFLAAVWFTALGLVGLIVHVASRGRP